MTYKIGKHCESQTNQSDEGDDSNSQNPTRRRTRPTLCRFTSIKTRVMVMDKVKELLSNKETRQKLKDVKFTPDFTQAVRQARKALVPHMLSLREEHKGERGYKCYLSYDKLSAGGTLYTLSEDGHSLTQAA